jgi:hypothetical protein
VYHNQIVDTLPQIFDTTIRKLLNKIVASYIGEPKCPFYFAEVAGNSSFINFWRFFDSAGNSYGDVPPLLKRLLDSKLMAIDPISGFAAVNDILVRPFTKSQSTETGSIAFPGDLFNQDTRVKVGGLDAKVQLLVSDARVSNLDTVRAPLSLLDALINAPNELNNTVTFGTSERPVRFATRVLISLTGDGAYSRFIGFNFIEGTILTHFRFSFAFR